MSEISKDYPQILLEENIPLSDEEVQRIDEEHRKIAKNTPIILGVCTFLLMAFAAFCIKDTFIKFKYYEYILFACGGLAMFGFVFLISLLVTGTDRRNWKKDKIHGKNKLSSIVIGSDITDYGEYLTLAGPARKDRIRILVKKEDYSRYKIGTKVVVFYLKYGKTALSIREL